MFLPLQKHSILCSAVQCSALLYRYCRNHVWETDGRENPNWVSDAQSHERSGRRSTYVRRFVHRINCVLSTCSGWNGPLALHHGRIFNDYHDQPDSYPECMSYLVHLPRRTNKSWLFLVDMVKDARSAHKSFIASRDNFGAEHLLLRPSGVEKTRAMRTKLTPDNCGLFIISQRLECLV